MSVRNLKKERARERKKRTANSLNSQNKKQISLRPNGIL